MITDLSHHFRRAAARRSEWTNERFKACLSEIAHSEHAPRVDWEWGEQWARIIFSPERPSGYVCRLLSLVLIEDARLEDLQSICARFGLEVVSMPSLAHRTYRVDEDVLAEYFGLTEADIQDHPAPCSGDDIWFATVL